MTRDRECAARSAGLPGPGSTDLAAYVELRLAGRPTLSRRVIDEQREKIEGRIAELEAWLVRDNALAQRREQGILFAWAQLQLGIREELEAVAREPWLERLGVEPGELGLIVTARLRDGKGRLQLAINCLAVPAVRILGPSCTALADRPLFLAALEALVVEGHLADVVVFCARRLGLELATSRGGQAPSLDPGIVQVYREQRAAWFCREIPGEQGQVSAPAEVVRQLDNLYQALFVLDQQVREMEAQTRRADSGRVRKGFENEYAALLGLPHVKCLSVEGDRAYLETDTLSVDGTCVGEFRVAFDFNRHALEIRNLTRPVLAGGTRYDHPHVRDGRVCLGNIRQHVGVLMAGRDLPRLVPLIIDFLTSYNPSSPFCRLEAWR